MYLAVKGGDRPSLDPPLGGGGNWRPHIFCNTEYLIAIELVENA